MNYDDMNRTNNGINHNEGNSIGTNDTGHIEKMDAFLDRVVAPIPGLREKKIVREEMKSHIEDEAFELMEEGVNEEAAYVEAVSNMGDASELAYELMMVHQYGSNAGFNKMVWVLWIGIFLTWLPSINQLPGKFTGWIGIYLVVFALYRMKTISKEFKKAFYAAYIGGLAAPMTLVSTVIPNAVLAYGIRVVAMLIFHIVGIVVMAKFLILIVGAILLPAIISIAISIWPVQGSYYILTNFQKRSKKSACLPFFQKMRKQSWGNIRFLVLIRKKEQIGESVMAIPMSG